MSSLRTAPDPWGASVVSPGVAHGLDPLVKGETMPEPAMLVVLGAAAGAVGTGAAGRLGERIVDRVWPERNAGDPSRHVAVQNAEAMFTRLEARMNELELQIGSGQATEDAVRAALQDPDFSYTVHQALLEGARTSNPARHEILSRAVVERIVAAPDSTQAVASALAIEAVARLSGPQMDILGLAALIYYVAPMVHGARPVESDHPRLVGIAAGNRDPVLIEIGRERVIEYLTWLVEVLDRHEVPEPVSTPDFAHLASASCATFDRTLHRDLVPVLQRLDEDRIFLSGLGNSYRQRLPEILYASPAWEKVEALWSRGLQHLTLTPAGLLIGNIVHQWKTQEEVRIQWELGTSDAFRDDSAWDGKEINRGFYERLSRRLEADLRAQMRSGAPMPWHLDR
jgi:hypothetical protein